MNEPYQPPERNWPKKFGDAGRGIWIAVSGGGSYTVHVFLAAMVVAAAFFFGITRTEWCILVLCIALVFAAEILNSGLELLAKAVRQEYDPLVRDALDIGSGAVLAASIGAAIVGLTIFVPYILALFSTQA
jgi:diacylglycerol kinase (ATP)